MAVTPLGARKGRPDNRPGLDHGDAPPGRPGRRRRRPAV